MLKTLASKAETNSLTIYVGSRYYSNLGLPKKHTFVMNSHSALGMQLQTSAESYRLLRVPLRLREIAIVFHLSKRYLETHYPVLVQKLLTRRVQAMILPFGVSVCRRNKPNRLLALRISQETFLVVAR